MLAELLQIYRCSVQAVRPDSLIKAAIKLENGLLCVNTKWPRSTTIQIALSNKDVYLFGAGKAVLRMCEEFLRQVDEYNVDKADDCSIHIVGGRFIVPIGSKSSAERLLRKYEVTYHEAARNNIPDEDSCRQTQALLDQIDSLCATSNANRLLPVVIGFISGGGSALLTCPKKAVTLLDKIDITQQLVKSGANIVELNTVRSCLSQVKSGKLASRIVGKCELVTFMVSDIINDPIDMIASGPTVTPKADGLSNSEKALAIIKKYNIQAKPAILQAIESEQHNVVMDALVSNIIVGNNQVALDAARARCNQINYKTISLGCNINGEAAKVAERFLQQILAFRPSENDCKQYGGVCWLGGGETTVTMKSQANIGLGGRCQHMGLVMLKHMLHLQHKSVPQFNGQLFVLLAGTDGQDGPTPAAGICLQLWPLNMVEHHNEIRQALERHDSYGFFSKFMPECVIETGPSGTNVMDIYCFILKYN